MVQNDHTVGKDRCTGRSQEPLLLSTNSQHVTCPYLSLASHSSPRGLSPGSLPHVEPTVTYNLVPLRSHTGTLSLGDRHMHSFSILFTGHQRRRKSSLRWKNEGLVSSGDIPIKNAGTYYFKERLPSLLICCSTHPLPTPRIISDNPLIN